MKRKAYCLPPHEDTDSFKMMCGIRRSCCWLANKRTAKDELNGIVFGFVNVFSFKSRLKRSERVAGTARWAILPFNWVEESRVYVDHPCRNISQ